MRLTLTQTSLALETAYYRGTDERFYTPDEAAAMLVSASELDLSRNLATSLRKAA